MNVGKSKTLTISKPVTITDKGGYIRPFSMNLEEGLYGIRLALTYIVFFAGVGPEQWQSELEGSVSLNYSMPYHPGDTYLKPSTPIKAKNGNDIWIQELHQAAYGLPTEQGPFSFAMDGAYDCRDGVQNLEFYIRLDSSSTPRGIMSVQCTAGKLDVKRRV